MWIPSLWLLAGTSALLSSTREVTPSRKAVLQPLSERSFTTQRGNHANNNDESDRVTTTTDGLVARVDSKSVAGNDIATYISNKGSITEPPQQKALVNGATKDNSSMALVSPGHDDGNNSSTKELDHSKGGRIAQIASAMVKKCIKTSGASMENMESRATNSLVLPTVSHSIKKQIGAMKSYCVIVPCRNVFSILGNLLASLRLCLLDKKPKYHTNYPMIALMMTASLVPGSMLYYAKSGRIMEFLRKRWAFQGECGDFSVEYMLNSMLNVLVVESMLRTVLRMCFYSKAWKSKSDLPQFVGSTAKVLSYCLGMIPKSINAIGTGIFGGYWNRETSKALVHMLVHSVVLARLIVFTAVQHAFFQENYDTASFIINPTISQIASGVSGVILALSTASSIGTMLMFKNFSNLADVEHLLDSSSFRATESQAAAISYARHALHNVPKMLKPTSLDILVKLSYYHEYISRLIPSGIEWPALLLHITMALNSNSAAGMYLALVTLMYAIVNQRLSNYERSVLTQDIQEIVLKSR